MEGYLVRNNVVDLPQAYYCAALKHFCATGAINLWNRMKLIGHSYGIAVEEDSKLKCKIYLSTFLKVLDIGIDNLFQTTFW